MLCCLKYIWYINKKNKIIDINNEEYNKLTNTCVSHSNNSLCSKINDKYVIIDNNIYVECNICFQIYPLQDIKVLYPCAHRLYCDLCIKNLKDCPTCRIEIKEKIKIYEKLDIEKEDN
jgi:hypothetical protein